MSKGDKLTDSHSRTPCFISNPSSYAYSWLLDLFGLVCCVSLGHSGLVVVVVEVSGGGDDGFGGGGEWW